MGNGILPGEWGWEVETAEAEPYDAAIHGGQDDPWLPCGHHVNDFCHLHGCGDEEDEGP